MKIENLTDQIKQATGLHNRFFDMQNALLASEHWEFWIGRLFRNEMYQLDKRIKELEAARRKYYGRIGHHG